MAILFSRATLTSGDSSTSFLIGGMPTAPEAFADWTAWQSFVEALPAGAEVRVCVTGYTYGDGEVVPATPEEVAYMMMRIRMRTDFLESRCRVSGGTEFCFTIDFPVASFNKSE